MARFHTAVIIATVGLLLGSCNAAVFGGMTGGFLQGAAQGWREGQIESRLDKSKSKPHNYRNYPQFSRVEAPNFPPNTKCVSTTESDESKEVTLGAFYHVSSEARIVRTKCTASGFRDFDIASLNTPIKLYEDRPDVLLHRYDGLFLINSKMAPRKFKDADTWRKYFRQRTDEWVSQLGQWKKAHQEEYKCNDWPKKAMCLFPHT